MITPERRRRSSGVFMIKFEYISHFFQMFLLMTLSRQIFAGFALHFLNNASIIFHSGNFWFRHLDLNYAGW